MYQWGFCEIWLVDRKGSGLAIPTEPEGFRLQGAMATRSPRCSAIGQRSICSVFPPSPLDKIRGVIMDLKYSKPYLYEMSYVRASAHCLGGTNPVWCGAGGSPTTQNTCSSGGNTACANGSATSSGSGQHPCNTGGLAATGARTARVVGLQLRLALMVPLQERERASNNLEGGMRTDIGVRSCLATCSKGSMVVACHESIFWPFSFRTVAHGSCPDKP